VVQNQQDGRLNGTRVVKLPKGSVSFESVLPGRVQGTITRLPPASSSNASVKKIKERDPAYKGLILPLSPISLPNSDGSAPAAAEESEGGDARGRDGLKGGKFVNPDAGLVSWSINELGNPALVLEVGDTIEFTAVVDRPTKCVRAEKVTLVKAALPEVLSLSLSLSLSHTHTHTLTHTPNTNAYVYEQIQGQSGGATKGEIEQGAIVFVKHQAKSAEHCAYGFIRTKDGNKRIMFNLADVDPTSLAAIAPAASKGVNGAGCARKEESGGVEEVEGDGECAGDVGEEAEQKDKEEDADKPGGSKVRRPKVGDEVEFAIFSDPNCRVVQAQDIRILPPGTVEFEQVSEKRLKGTVSEWDPNSTKQGGKLLHKEEDGGGTCVLSFAAADISDLRYLMLKGASVEYSVATDRQDPKPESLIRSP